MAARGRRLSPLGPVWPVLRPPEWPGRAHSLCRPLVGHPDPTWIPWVAFAHRTDGLAAFVGADRDLAAVEEDAVARLRAHPVEWRLIEGDHDEPPVAIIEGEHAAERILDDGTLWRLAESELGADVLAIGIPRTGLLLATSAALAMERPFVGVVADLYQAADPTARLTPRVLAVADGRITGVLF